MCPARSHRDSAFWDPRDAIYFTNMAGLLDHLHHFPGQQSSVGQHHSPLNSPTSSRGTKPGQWPDLDKQSSLMGCRICLFPWQTPRNKMKGKAWKTNMHTREVSASACPDIGDSLRPEISQLRLVLGICLLLCCDSYVPLHTMTCHQRGNC